MAWFGLGGWGVGRGRDEEQPVRTSVAGFGDDMRTFIDTAQISVFGVDRDRRVNVWNSRVEELMGRPASDVMGKNLVDVVSEGNQTPAETRNEVIHLFEEAFAGRRSPSVKVSYLSESMVSVDAQALVVEVLITASPLKDADGLVHGVLGFAQDISESRCVDVDLERARVTQELQTFVDTANAPIFGIDKHGRVNEWNNKAAEITGFTRDEVMGQDLVQVYITEEFRASVKEVLDDALKGKEASNFEFPLFTKVDKKRVDVLLNATTRRDASGHAVGVIGVGQDITERKTAEAQHARIAQELQNFIDTANAPIFGIDAKGRVNEWNNKAAEITGFTRDEVMGQDLVKVYITQEYRASVKEVLDLALQGREAANFEFPLFTKDQRRVEVLLNATTRKDVAGNVIGVLGVGQDITERKTAELEQARVAKELQTFIDTANAPIFGIDAKGRVNEWNNKAAEITGFTRDEVMGQDLVQVYITEEYRASVKEVLDLALQGREAANFEFPLYTKFDKRVDVLLNATTRRDVSGNVVGVLGVGQDITERKTAELEQARVAKELQTFIDTANAPIFGIDAKGRVNEWNNKAAEITGFTRDEVMGQDLVQVYITEEFRASVKEVLDLALQGREAANFEFPLYTKIDNKRVDVLLNATTRRDVSGNVVGMLGVGQDITERKTAELEQARVAKELQTFIDTANAPIFGIDAKGRVNEWNNKAAEITGFTRDEVMGKDLVQVYITKEYRASVKEVLDDALKGKEASNFEFPLFTKDQRRVEVLLNATTRKDVAGNVVGVLGVGQDITERKTAELEQARVAKELQNFIDTANAPIFGIDAKGRVNEWNNKAAEITGFTRDEVMGQDLVEVYITEEYRASVKEVLDLALKGKEASNFEFPLYTQDKRRVDVLLNATTRRDVSGNVVGVLGVGQDITERKTAELEQARVAQELQTFIDTANAPIFGIDAKGRVNEWNNKAAEITGFTRDEVMGKSLVDVYITEEFRSSVRSVLDNALAGREASNFEFPLFTKFDKRVDVLLNATTRRDVSGNVVGVLGVGQDITERKTAELEQARVAQELQTFIDTANAPIFGIDAKGRVNEWNNKAAEITGFTRDEVMGQDLVKVYITEEYRVSVKEVLDDALKGKEASNFEFPLFTKDQRRVEVLLNATTRKDVAGNVIGVLGVGQDITERKTAELEQARVAKELQNFIDTANAPIFGIDAKGRVNEWNNKAAEITGFTRDEVMGQDLVEVYITEEFRASVKEVLDLALQGKEAANFEFPLYTQDKRRVDVLLNATTRRDVSGNVVGMLGVGQDITERKTAELEQARVAKELQTFIDTANAPIFGIDAKGRVNEWNNKAAEITGFTRDEVMGQDLVQVYITEEFRASVKEVLDDALKGKEAANFEFPLFTKNEKRVDVLLNATTRRDASGNSVGVIGVGQNITERKLIEVEMTRVAKELQTFIDTANAPIFGIDAKGRVNEWNNKAAEITGFTRDEVMGQDLVQVYITKEYRASVKEVLDDALKGKEASNFEFPLFTKIDNKQIDVLLNATTRRDASGHAVGVIGVGQDITARKLIEVEMTRVAKELQTFIDTANAPIFGIDAKGRVNEWNNKAAEITGFTRDEVMGQDLVEVYITEEFRASVKEVLDDALKGKEAANFEFPLFTKNEKRVDVLLNATTRRDASGHAVGVIGVGQDITERKLIEVEMTRVAKELQNFIDTANAPIFGIDAKGRVNEWNNKAAEITGFTRDEVMGQDLVKVYITEEYRASVKEVLDLALQGREAANFEFPLFTKDQRRVEVLLNATTRKDVAGNVIGVLGVGQDITERKTAELEQARVAKELQTFIDTANAPIFGIDAKGRVNEWNNKAAEITGFTRDEVMGQDLVQVYITEEFRASVKEVLDLALQGREAANFEFPLYTKIDNKRVDVLLNATTRRDVSGNVVGMLGVGQDITERKTAELEQARVAQELQTFIDTANAPIFGIDAKGRVNEWNNKAAEITGFTRDEVMGQDLVEVYITEEFRASVKEVLDDALKGKEAANFEFPLFTKNEKRVDVLLNATTRRDASGNAVGVIGVGQDITERKLIEVEMTRVAKELQNFIDTANAPIFGIDAKGRVNEWNNKAAEITGFTRDEVMGQDLVKVYITEEYRASVKEVLDLALQGREAANFEFPLFTKDQRRVEVLLNATTRKDVAGNVVGVLGVGQDITERKTAELEQARVAKELQNFIDTANAPIFGIDAKGRVNEWNNKAAEITGFTRDEVMGQDLVEVYITEEYRASVKEVLDLALQGREAANFEFPLYTQDKRRVDVLLNATTRRDVSGNVVGVLGVGQDITERKTAELEQARVAKELQTFIDTANAPIFGIDAKGRVNEWNNKAAEITGFTRDEVMGKSLVDVYITEEFRPSVRSVLDNALAGREAANFEFPLFTKSDKRVDVLLNATTRRDVSGNVVGVLGVGQDITERKTAELEQARVAKELQNFIDTANAPIFGIDAKGRVNEWNNKAAEITGFTRDEVMGQDLVQVYITEEFRASVKEVLDLALQGREAANFEFPLYTKDKRRVDVLLNATTRRDVSGNVVGMLGVGQDITERKTAELEQARVAQELQTFIDTANAPIFGIDAKGRVNEWNNKAAEITGFTRDEVMGQDLVEVYITEEFRASVKEVLDDALKGKEAANFEFPLFTKNEKRVDVLLNATTRRDASGHAVGVIGVGQDITERKLIEVEMTRVAKELQNFIDTANAPIFGIDAKGRVNEWNNKAAEITGFTRDEVMGQDLVKVYITEEYRASVKEVLDLALQGREAANFEFPLFTKDQRRVEVLLNATTRKDVAGNVIGVLGVGQDITERKTAELEQARVAKELQTFIDTANAPIFGIDAKGRVNEWNNKAAEITGFTRDEVMGQDLVEVYITEEYRASVKEVLDLALQGREAANFEFPLYTQDKRRVDVLLNATTRRDVSGNVVGVLGVGQDITERKTAELEQARVVQELQTFIDTANAPIFGIDAKGRVNEWNNKAAEITGFTRDEVMGKSLVDVYITEEFRPSVRSVLDNALAGREASNFEFPLFTKSDKRVDVLLNATTRRDVSGNVVGVLGVGQDITERKTAELEQARVAKELQNFIDTANAPIFGIDAKGRVNEWNNKAAEITGFTRDEVMGQDLVQVYITEEFRASVKEVLDLALQGREAANFEFPLYTKDKRRVDVLLNATTRRDVSGNVVGMLGVGQDITERKTAELEQARVAQELQTFIDTANAPIFGIDAKGRVNEWNNKAAEITGFTRDEVMGQDLVEVYITEEFRASVKEVLDDALKGKEAANFEFPLFTKNKNRVDVLLNATTRRDASGHAVGVIGVGQDITERKLIEVEMTRVAKELQNFIDTANAPIFGIDAKGRVNEWNNKAAEITGFTRDEVMGQDLVKVYITEEYRASVKEVLDLALQGREAANFEFPLFTKDQRRVEVLLNATTRKDVAGNVVGVLGVGQDITERKTAELEQARVAKELQNFIDTANAPIFGIDAKGRVNEWNNKAAEITGFTRNEVMGQDLVEVYITEEYRASVKEVLDLALQGKEAANFEFPLYTQDKRRVDVLLNATTRRDVSGNVVGVLGVGQDITERKTAELEQARVAKELQTFIDTANAPIFGIDAKGRVNEWNNKAAEITGFTRDEVMGKSLVDVYITEEFRPSVRSVLDNALAGREASNFEFPLFTKSDKRVDVLLNATTRRDVSGNVVGVLGVGQDITERKTAELEQARVAKELQNFIDTANAPIFGIDAKGRVNEWNNKAAEITGFTRDEVMGQDLVEVYITEEFRASVKEVLDLALQGREAANFEFPLYTKIDNKRVDVLLNATTRRDVSGNVVGMLGVGQDITERKTAELEQARVAQELQTFIDTANAPIFGIDAKGRVNEWNNKAAEITGFTRDEVMGQDLVEVYITEEFRASVKEVLDDALKGKEAANFEFPLFTKNEKRVDVLLNATTRRDASGHAVGVIGVGQDITERKLIEVEMTRVAKELQNFIDTANAPIFGIDAKGRVNEWNNKAAEITGFTRDEVMGQDLVQVYITEEYRVSVKGVLDDALKGKEASNFEFPLFTKDEKRVEVLLNATTRRDASGNSVGVIGVGQDITERKLIEVEMTRVARELQTFIDTANAPIFGIDAKGHVNEWNNKAAEITGFTRDEVMGQDLVEVYITKEFRASVKEVLDDALKGKEASNFEFPLFTKIDKKRVDVLLNATTRRDVGGNVIGVIGVGQDITERKKVEEEKVRVAKELQIFIDTANAPIFGIDAKGLVNEWNNKAVEITGFTKQEVLGKDLVEVYITKEFRQSVKSVLDNALMGKEAANFEFPLFTSDQRRVEVLLNATTRRDVTGSIVGVIGVGQDITEMRRLMEQETLLFQAQAANETKSQFLATMSHEMRTPLNVIMGMSQLMIDTYQTPEQTKFTEQIMTSSESLLILINDILDLTKVEAGKLELSSIEFDVRQVMEDAVDSVASKAFGKGLEICSYLDPMICTTAFGDPDRLRQILLNLLSNGIKFTNTGQIYVVVELEDQTVTHNTFRFKVYDSGIGITEEGQKKLFNRFSQVDSSTTRTYGGTGLGLAISKQFAELMNGTMGVDSREGKGSLFWFNAMFQKLPEDAVSAVTPAAFPQLGSDNIRYTVLVVAANETLRNSTLNMLEKLSLNAILVATSDEALAVEDRFDVVIFCPSVDSDGRGIFDDIENSALSNSGDSLITCRKTINTFRERLPMVKYILMCPINQLSQSSEFRAIPECVVLSRPARASHIHTALQSLLQNVVLPEDLTLTAAKNRPVVDAAAGIRMIIFVKDQEQRTVLGAILTRDIIECFMCDSVEMLSRMLKHSNQHWSHHILFIELENDEVGLVATICSKLRQIEKENDIKPALTIVGVVSTDAYADVRRHQESAKIGVDLLISKPVQRDMVNKVVDTKLHETRSSQLLTHAQGPERSEMQTISSRLRSSEDDRKKLRILVVDDDSGQRMVLKSMLTKEGYDVDCAEDGVQAVRAVACVSYDVVLMDGFMPNKTGWEATADIRADESRRGAMHALTIIGVTGATSKDDEVKCRQAGMTDMITKPVKREQLRAKVQQWTKNVDIGSAASQADERHSDTESRGSNEGIENPILISSNVLFLCSDKGQCTIVKSILRQLRIVLHVTGNSEEALDRLKKVPLDCIMIDTNILPTIDEVEIVVRKIRDLTGPLVLSMPIFAVSDLDDVDGLMAVGFTDVISKPVERAAFHGMLTRHGIPRNQAAASLHPTPDPQSPQRRDPIKIGLRVLVVEDHWANRRLLEAMLVKEGHVMEAVENGLEACNIAKAREYDIILMDCNMPIMDGWQATQKIRELPGPNQNTPIIAVTANAMKGDRDKCLQAGMNDYISKPVERKRMLLAIKKWTEQRSKHATEAKTKQEQQHHETGQ